MAKGISLIALTCLFFSLSGFALAEENSPHFFGKSLRPRASLQKVGSPVSEFPKFFEKTERPAKRLFGKKLDLSSLLESFIPVKKIFFLSGVKRIHINLDVDIVFKDENR
jgi:hypothetical protein